MFGIAVLGACNGGSVDPSLTKKSSTEDRISSQPSGHRGRVIRKLTGCSVDEPVGAVADLNVPDAKSNTHADLAPARTTDPHLDTKHTAEYTPHGAGGSCGDHELYANDLAKPPDDLVVGGLALAEHVRFLK